MNLKSIIIFLSGAAMGGSVAAFVTHKKMKAKFERLSDEKIASMKQYVDTLREKDAAGDLSEGLGYVSKEGKEPYDETRESKKYEKIDYSKYYKIAHGNEVVDMAESESPSEDSYEDESVDVDEEALSEERRVELSRQMNENRNSKEKPKIIKAEEFDEYEYHDKVTLYYYQEDQFLTTEDEEIVDDPVAYIGDALTKYGFDRNEEDVIYVRNTARGTDYEIAKVFAAYGD